MKSQNSKPRFKCPQCGKPVQRQAENFPFCSDRCRLIDLGHWAAGDYRIAGDPAAVADDDDGSF